MSKKLCSVSGNPCAGKSTAAEQLARELEIPFVTGSTILSEWATERSVELIERTDYCAFMYKMRKELGATCLIEAVLERQNDNGIMYDGMRNISDFELFQSIGGVTAAYWCPFEVRLQRGCEKGDPKDATTAEAFQQAEAAEYDNPDRDGIQTIRVMQMADFFVDATKSPAQVLEATRQGFLSRLALR